MPIETWVFEMFKEAVAEISSICENLWKYKKATRHGPFCFRGHHGLLGYTNAFCISANHIHTLARPVFFVKDPIHSRLPVSPSRPFLLPSLLDAEHDVVVANRYPDSSDREACLQRRPGRNQGLTGLHPGYRSSDAPTVPVGHRLGGQPGAEAIDQFGDARRQSQDRSLLFALDQVEVQTPVPNQR